MSVPMEPTLKIEPLQQLAALTLSGLREAVHSRIAGAVVALLIAGVVLALFIGEVAISDSERIQPGMLAAFLRPGILFILSLFVVNSCVREFQQPCFLVLLSLPMHRATLMLARLLAFSLISALVVLLTCAILALFAPLAHLPLWGLTLWLESLIVISFSLVCALSFSQVPMAVFLTGAFYLLSRCIPAMLLIANNPAIQTSSTGHTVLLATVEFIALLLPDLDQFARSEYIMYGAPETLQLGTLIAQSGTYIILLAGIALFDLYRRNF